MTRISDMLNTMTADVLAMQEVKVFISMFNRGEIPVSIK